MPKVVSGSSNRPLAARVSTALSTPLAVLTSKTFEDGEISVRFEQHVRGDDLFIVQPVCPPHVNDAMIELLLIIDAAKRASAKRVTAIMPYYGYARQDRKALPRTPISAKLVADMLVTAGVDRVVLLDVHAPQIQGFFPAKVPVDHIPGHFCFIQPILDMVSEGEPITVVSPDVGGAARARRLARFLQAELAIVDKRREVANHCEVMNVVGSVTGRTCVLYDDMIDTGRSLCKSAAAIKSAGATRVIACATHGLLSGEAAERLRDSVIDKVLLSDTVPISPEKRAALGSKLVIVSCAELLAAAIECVHSESSLGTRLQTMSSHFRRIGRVRSSSMSGIATPLSQMM
eukprot:gnl/Dysnectes_brevis/754_a829_3683.p1 GENE.gnl/Dysnectes_brevis/754_a829_3683~~gnl/Dysnectes_brevis/754_a829_3683.p1  ORF type:complete len:346 (+),score=94.73 gnl/Dysnectes_brevis/754_a829_3683:53-1090(+)